MLGLYSVLLFVPQEWMSAYNKKGLRKKSLSTDKEGRRLSEVSIPSTPVSGVFNISCFYISFLLPAEWGIQMEGNVQTRAPAR